HKRFAFPVAALVFALVGFPLAVRSHRGGRSIALVGSLVILVSYYLMMTTLERVALRGTLPAAIAIWTPNAVFAAIGGMLLLVTARERRAPRMNVMLGVFNAVGESVPGLCARRVRVASTG